MAGGIRRRADGSGTGADVPRSGRRLQLQSRSTQRWMLAAEARSVTSAPAVVELQQTAGNRATTALVRRIAAGTVQRDHADATAGGATTRTGVTVPTSGNWNAQDLTSVPYD